ncbi:hypothetical protein C2E23DRAFT_732357 [Lenzites betulinus]|nr:hypothetical protein C2E23DRAFT_732357 [Lenzites betulinus]
MSSTRRHDLAERATMNDESATFKKAFQTVGRPAVTERDFHEEYIQDPPRNDQLEFVAIDNRTRGLKEGARAEETDLKQDGVLGNQPVGKESKESVLESVTTTSSVHPGNTS